MRTLHSISLPKTCQNKQASFSMSKTLTSRLSHKRNINSVIEDQGISAKSWVVINCQTKEIIDGAKYH